MTNYKKVAISLLVGLILIAALINISNAATMSMTVPAGEEINRKINLAVDDRVIIQFTVIGQKTASYLFHLFAQMQLK